MSEPAQLTKEQVMEILKNVVVSVDVSENAVIISTKRLLSYFLSNEKDIDSIIKVDVNDNKEVVVYASAKPPNPDIKSVILKVTLRPDALKVQGLKYELVKAGDDVHIKVYVQQSLVTSASNANADKDVDF